MGQFGGPGGTYRISKSVTALRPLLRAFSGHMCFDMVLGYRRRVKSEGSSGISVSRKTWEWGGRGVVGGTKKG